jgi:hypothetical protein
MDEYYDDGYEDEDEEKIQKFQKKQGEFKTNPNGPYNFEMKFKGVHWIIKIESLSLNDFKVTAASDIKVRKKDLDILKKYLQDEGFEQAARKHNLFW